jgi:hypothetical protein
VTKQVPSPADLADIPPEAAALRDFSSACAALLGNVQTAQDPDCPAARDLASATEPELVETAFAQGSLLSLAARDQAEALARSLTEPVRTIAPWPITRNLLETSAIGAWLLDPAIDARQRVSRSFAARYNGLLQQVRVARDAGSQVEGSQSAMDRLVATAQRLGYPIIHNDKGRVDGVAERMPSITDLVGDVLEARVEYRILCAVVHGHGWAMMQLGLADQGPAEGQVIGQRSRAFRKALSPIAVKFACVRSGDALYKIHEYTAKLFGADTAPLQESFEAFERVFAERGDDL